MLKNAYLFYSTTTQNPLAFTSRFIPYLYLLMVYLFDITVMPQLHVHMLWYYQVVEATR